MTETSPASIIVPVLPKKSFPKWPLIALLAFFLGIASVFAYQKWQPARSNPAGLPSFVSPKPSAEAESVDQTANWKTYTNEKYGYQISYPTEWTLETDVSNPHIVTIQSEDGLIWIDPTNYTKITEPINGWIERSNQQLLSDPNRHSASSPMQIIKYNNELQIEEIPVTLDASFFSRDGKSYIFKHNNSIFYITAVYYTGEYDSSIKSDKISNDERLERINLILSTFKFLDNGEKISNKTCQYNGITYQDGETFPDKCNSCSCESGQVACTLMACED